MGFNQDDAAPDRSWPSEISGEPLTGSSIVEGNDVELSPDPAFGPPTGDEPVPGATVPPPPEPPLDPNDPRSFEEYQRQPAQYNQTMTMLSNVQQTQHEIAKDITRNLRG